MYYPRAMKECWLRRQLLRPYEKSTYLWSSSHIQFPQHSVRVKFRVLPQRPHRGMSGGAEALRFGFPALIPVVSLCRRARSPPSLTRIRRPSKVPERQGRRVRPQRQPHVACVDHVALGRAFAEVPAKRLNAARHAEVGCGGEFHLNGDQTRPRSSRFWDPVRRYCPVLARCASTRSFT